MIGVLCLVIIIIKLVYDGIVRIIADAQADSMYHAFQNIEESKDDTTEE